MKKRGNVITKCQSMYGNMLVVDVYSKTFVGMPNEGKKLFMFANL